MSSPRDRLPTPSPALVGRTSERARLDAVLDALVLGRGGAWTLVGAAGSGKTTLLDRTVADAQGRGLRVARLVGSDTAAALPWGAVAELAAPLLGHLDEVAAVRARALRCALALEEGDGPPDPLAVALGLLDLLAEAAAERPTLVVIDDLPWLDAESRAALALVARRLGDDAIAMLASARPGGSVVGEPWSLGPLERVEIAELLGAHGVRAPVAVATIADLADGSPLLALRLAASLRPEERSGSRPLPPTLRVPAEVVDLYGPALDGLRGDASTAVAVVAADASGDAEVVARALDHLGLGIEDLEDAEVADLVVVDGAEVRFSHPLARQAAYQALPAPLRRRAHDALARAEGPESAAGTLHRAAAAVGVDEAIATALAKLGDDAMSRGAPLTAADRFVQAATRSPEPVDRADRLVGAARAAASAGEPTWAAELLATARDVEGVRAGQLDARSVEVRVQVALGHLDRARQLAEEADAAHGADDGRGVADVLAEVAVALLVADPSAVGPIAERMWALAGSSRLPVSPAIEVVYGCGRFVQGDAEGAARHTAAWRSLLERDGPVSAGPLLARTVVLYLGYTQRPLEALAILDEVEPALRASCATGALVPVLSARSYLSYGIDLRACVAAGRDALVLSEETGQAGLSPMTLQTLSIAAATVGDDELTEDVCRRLLASGAELDEVWARASLGRLHLVSDRPVEAAEQFALLRRRIGPHNRTMVSFESDEADALLRAGRPADAAALVPVLAAGADRSPWSKGQHERVLALLAADIDESVAHFAAAAEALDQTDNRIAQGINQLEWGEWLRRAKRRAEARRHLERAIELFDLVGSQGFRRRAIEELAAAGGAVDRTLPTDELLGVTELRVARLAAAGETNRAIATALFLSPRTVENHLGAVYRKLGVAGRPGLVARAASDHVLQIITGVD